MARITNRLLLAASAALLLGLAGCADPTAQCTSPDLECGGSCVSPQVDPNNCGACGIACAGNTVCSDGVCVCPSGQTDCDGRCVDTRTSALHCGGCGNACEAGGACVDGACQEGCDGVLCDGVCTDTQTDTEHCGGCGIECGDGQHCLAGTCAQGDLYAACFQAGTVIPFLKASGERSGKAGDMMGGPQSLALLGKDHLVAVGTLDDTLYVFDRATMDRVGTLVLAPEAGQMPSQLLIAQDRGIVINSNVNTVQVVDLKDPTNPKTLYEVSTRSNTRPIMAAFDEEGTLWVSLADTNQVVPVTLGETSGEAGAAVDLEAAEGSNPYPAGVTVLDGVVYVALNNLDDDWSPAGNGRLATYEVESEQTGLIDLGADCTNPGSVASDGGLIYVVCTGTYEVDDGSLVVFDPATDSMASVALGGSPSRLSLDPSQLGRVYVAVGVNVVELDGEGDPSMIEVCSAANEFEFVADVLAAP